MPQRHRLDGLSLEPPDGRKITDSLSFVRTGRMLVPRGEVSRAGLEVAEQDALLPWYWCADQRTIAA